MKESIQSLWQQKWIIQTTHSLERLDWPITLQTLSNDKTIGAIVVWASAARQGHLQAPTNSDDEDDGDAELFVASMLAYL